MEAKEIKSKYGVKINLLETINKIILNINGGYITLEDIYMRLSEFVDLKKIELNQVNNIRQLISRVINDKKNKYKNNFGVDFNVVKGRLMKICNVYEYIETKVDDSYYKDFQHYLKTQKLDLKFLKSIKFDKSQRIGDAVASSTIENEPIEIQGTDIESIRIEDKKRELINFLELDKFLVKLDFLKMSHSLLQKIHELYFKDIISFKFKRRRVGKYRAVQNWLSDGYKPISFIHLQEELDKWFAIYNKTPKNDYEGIVIVGILHAWFERIHPFDDGNGRVGRYLIEYYLYLHKLTPAISFPSSQLILLTKDQYKSNLNTINKSVGYSSWLAYWLPIIAIIAKNPFKNW